MTRRMLKKLLGKENIRLNVYAIMIVVLVMTGVGKQFN